MQKKGLFALRANEKLPSDRSLLLANRMIREREPDLRRHPRAQVRWPVTVKSGDRSFDLHTLNLSPFGAKVILDAPAFEPGTPAELHFQPPGGRPFSVHAIVWRNDPDGSAFFFIGVEGEEYSFPTESWPADSCRTDREDNA